MSPLQKEYQNLKIKFPNSIIWFNKDEFIQCYSECAMKTSEILGTVLTNNPNNNDLLITGFSETSLGNNLKKMNESGYGIILVSL